MKRFRNSLLRFGMAGITVAMVVLGLGGPVSEAAASTILIDNSLTAVDCGKYTGQMANIDPVDAITNDTVTGSTVIVCPGTYNLNGLGTIAVVNKKLTIKRAVTGPGSRPIFEIDPAANSGIWISNSQVTIDGLVLDGRLSGSGYNGIIGSESSIDIKESAVIGPNQTVVHGINVSNVTNPGQKLSITNSYIAGYTSAGVRLSGLVKMSMTSNFLDATDGGRVASGGSLGVSFNGQGVPAGAPTGTVGKNRIINNSVGVVVQSVSKVNVSNNILVDNIYGVSIITVGGYPGANNTKVTGNTIMGVPAGGFGVRVADLDPVNVPSLKTTVSNNVISSFQYTSGGLPTGIYFYANPSSPANMTGTVSRNRLIGFDENLAILIDGAGVTVKANDMIP